MDSNRRQLKSRWKNEQGRLVSAEIVRRLISGVSLGDLPLERHGGRTDLRGIDFPAPRFTRFESPLRNMDVYQANRLVEISNVQLGSLDLSHARLDHLRFFHTVIEDCLFEHAQCRDWRLWAVDVTASSFKHAKLEGSAVGTWYDGRPNFFRGVSFLGADLTDIACDDGQFIDCDFSQAKLRKIDFGVSAFVRCRFAGELYDIVFYGRPVGGEDHGLRNSMEGVDFTDAELRFVGFRLLDLKQVRLPKSAHHIVIDNYRCVVEHALRELASEDTPFAKGLRGLLKNERRWILPDKPKGLFNQLDLGRTESERARAKELLTRLDEECAES